MDYEKNSLLAVSSLYGVDILLDNVQICRDNLYKIWKKQYKAVCKRECSDDVKRSIRFILERNIVCGNALTLMTVDENGKDTDAPITFSIEVEPSVATASFSEEQPASVPHIINAAVKILIIFFIITSPFRCKFVCVFCLHLNYTALM